MAERRWLAVGAWVAVLLLAVLAVATSSFTIHWINGSQDIARVDKRLTGTVRGVSYATVVFGALAVFGVSVWAVLREIEQ